MQDGALNQWAMVLVLLPGAWPPPWRPATPCCPVAEPGNHTWLCKDYQFFWEAEEPHHCPLFTDREMVHKEAK